MIDASMIAHFRSIGPALDKRKKFVWFHNHKVAQVSISRHLLDDRIISPKRDGVDYYAHFDSHRPDAFQKMFKFTVVRNPWDKVVSAFFYLNLSKQLRRGFADFILGVLSEYERPEDFNIHFDRQYPKAFFDGKQFVDFIARLENIDRDWLTISREIDCSPMLPHANRSRHRDYRVYYNDETASAVATMYAEDIDAFGYAFD